MNSFIEMVTQPQKQNEECNQKVVGQIFQLYLFKVFEQIKAKLAEIKDFFQIQFEPLFILALTTNRQNKSIFRFTALKDYCFCKLSKSGKTNDQELQLIPLAYVQKQLKGIVNYYKKGLGFSDRQIPKKMNQTRTLICRILNMGDYKQFACEYIKSSKKIVNKQKTLDFVIEFFSQILGEDFVPVNLQTYVSEKEKQPTRQSLHSKKNPLTKDEAKTVDSVQNSEDVPLRPNLRKRQQKARKIQEKKKKEEKPQQKIDISLWKKKLREFKKTQKQNPSSLYLKLYAAPESIGMLQHQNVQNLNDNPKTEGQIKQLNSTANTSVTSRTVLVATSETLSRRQDENNERTQQPIFEGENDWNSPASQTINQNQDSMVNQFNSPHQNSLNNLPPIILSPESIFRQQSPILSDFFLLSNNDCQESIQPREKDNPLLDQEQNSNDISSDLDFELEQNNGQIINVDTSNHQNDGQKTQIIRSIRRYQDEQNKEIKTLKKWKKK